ncbi:MAG TPA: hypothetical protein VKX49_27630 [Bryobacteraceae bacterium]|nr:hypothetical protein [Bryobacteraceae bacterium]
MAQSQTGLISSARARGVVPPGSGDIECATAFRFKISWTWLTAAPDPAKVLTQPISLVSLGDRQRPAMGSPRVVPSQPSASPLSEPQTAALGAELVPVTPRPTGAKPTVQWEMVVPKMVRSAAKKPAPADRHPAASAPPAATTPVEQAPPNLYTASSTFRKSFSFKLCAGFVVLAAASIPLWRRHSARPVSTEIQTSIDGGDWHRESAVGGDPGLKQYRQLVIYRPSLKSTDARLEFDWTVASGPVGIVFRAKDLGNYYAVRLKVLKSGAMPTLAAEYFSVYRFVESPHNEKVLVFSRNDPALHIRVDIFGPMFTLYLQGSATEYWNDAKLSSGALGFFEEWNQTAEIHGVRMSFPQGSQSSRAMPSPDLRELLALARPRLTAHARFNTVGGL